MNYGHIVLDALSSLAALDATGLFGAHALVVPPPRPRQARHFALMGAEPQEPQEPVAPVARVGELVYTSAVHRFLHNPNLDYRDPRARQIAAVRPGAGRPTRLFLSRGRGDRRAMRSEARLAAALRRGASRRSRPAAWQWAGRSRSSRAPRPWWAPPARPSPTRSTAGPGALVVEIMPGGMENHWV